LDKKSHNSRCSKTIKIEEEFACAVLSELL
jgi:hypothetical protein